MLQTRADFRVDRVDGRAPAASSRRRWLFDSMHARALTYIRTEFAQDPRCRAISSCNAELVLGELLGNVARYAPGSGYVEIRWDRGFVTIDVGDSGPGFTYEAALPEDPLSVSGRGLYLVALYSREVSVCAEPRGGSRVSATVETPPAAITSRP